MFLDYGNSKTRSGGTDQVVIKPTRKLYNENIDREIIILFIKHYKYNL